MYVAGRKKSLGRGRGRGWLIPAEGETLPCLALVQVAAMTGAVRYIAVQRCGNHHGDTCRTLLARSSKGYPLETRGR